VRGTVLVPGNKVLEGGGEHAGVEPVLLHHPGGQAGQTGVSHRVGDLMQRLALQKVEECAPVRVDSVEVSPVVQECLYHCRLSWFV